MKLQETSKRKSQTSEPLKGDATKAAILNAALEVAEVSGLQGITIGLLAEKTDMSKSGVFAHFKASYFELQLSGFTDATSAGAAAKQFLDVLKAKTN